MLRYLLASLVFVLMEGTRSVTAFTAPGLLPARAAGLARLCGRSVPGGQGTKQRLALDRGVLSRPMGSAMSASPSAPSATAESEMVGSGDRLDSVPWEESVRFKSHTLAHDPIALFVTLALLFSHTKNDSMVFLYRPRVLASRKACGSRCGITDSHLPEVAWKEARLARAEA